MMAAPRLFVDDDLGEGNEIRLDKQRSHYLRSVMRLNAGAYVRLFNGRQGEWRSRIADAAKSVTLEVLENRRIQSAVADLWLVFAPVKKDRMDFLVEKATELGVSDLLPVITRRTIVSRVNTDRLKAQVIEASEQCERLDIPTVHEAVKLSDLKSVWPDDRVAFVLDEAGSGGSAAIAMSEKTGRPAACISGPEGGYEKSELDLLRTLPNFVPVSLGPRILRAETAALTSLAIWQSVCGDGGVPPVPQMLRD